MRKYGLLISLLLALSCTSTWKDPNGSIPATKASVVSILATPTAFDSAGVTVKGMIWDLAYGDLTFTSSGYIEQRSFAIFKLADKYGNFVNVFTDGSYNLGEGDIVEVTGIYRRNYQSERRHSINEIEAKSIKVLKSLTDKYSKDSG